jgi:hypothetical protein
LALVISVGTVCRKLSFGDPVHSLAFTVSIMTDKQSASGDKWDWNNLTNGDDDIAVPFYGGWWPSPFKPIFTALATKEKVKREDMKSNFERLQSDGMLLPCRLDEGDSCFREITPSVTDYFAKLLRSSSATDASEPRLLLHNPLQEGTFLSKDLLTAFSCPPFLKNFLVCGLNSERPILVWKTHLGWWRHSRSDRFSRRMQGRRKRSIVAVCLFQTSANHTERGCFRR